MPRSRKRNSSPKRAPVDAPKEEVTSSAGVPLGAIAEQQPPPAATSISTDEAEDAEDVEQFILEFAAAVSSVSDAVDEMESVTMGSRVAEREEYAEFVELQDQLRTIVASLQYTLTYI